MTTNLKFYDQVIHTDVSELPALRDHTAAQFLMKMAALKATVTFGFDKDLWIVAATPLGRYTFTFDADDDPDLIVDQVL